MLGKYVRLTKHPLSRNELNKCKATILMWGATILRENRMWWHGPLPPMDQLFRLASSNYGTCCGLKGSHPQVILRPPQHATTFRVSSKPTRTSQPNKGSPTSADSPAPQGRRCTWQIEGPRAKARAAGRACNSIPLGSHCAHAVKF